MKKPKQLGGFLESNEAFNKRLKQWELHQVKIKDVNKAIQKEVAKEYRKEAKGLVKLAPEGRIDELLELHRTDNGSIFCLCLDSIRYNLILKGEIKESDFPSFGNPFGL